MSTLTKNQTVDAKSSGAKTTLPPLIVEKLDSLVRRMRRVVWFRGLLAVAASATAMLLVLMAVDLAAARPPTPARWGLTLAGLAALVAAWIYFVSSPLKQRMSLAAVARMVEIQHPELQERISSTVELRGGSETPGVAMPGRTPYDPSS